MPLGTLLLLSLTWRFGTGAEYNWRVVQRVVAPDGYPKLVYVVMDMRLYEVIPDFFFPLGTVDSAHALGRFNREIYHGDDFPSGTLRVKQFERVIINVENQCLGREFLIHWHGLDMRMQGYMDGAPGLSGCPIGWKTTQVIDFNVTNGPGTYWYHSHTAGQSFNGFSGMIVVEAADGQVDNIKEQYQYTEEAEIMFGEYDHANDDQYLLQTQKMGSYNVTLENAYGEMEERPVVNSVMYMKSYHVAGRAPDMPSACHHLSFDDAMYRKYNGPIAGLAKEGFFPHYQVGTKSPRSPLLFRGWALMSVASSPNPPSFWGNCDNSKIKPRVFKCPLGGTLLLRLINHFLLSSGIFWVDRHHMTIVRQTGIETVPTNHLAAFIPAGANVDAIIHCDQDPNFLYKMQGQMDMMFQQEQAWFAQELWIQYGTYAVLDYGIGATHVLDPLFHISDFHAQNTTMQRTNSGTRRFKGFWNDYEHIDDFEEYPVSIFQFAFHSPPTVVTPPAKQRVFFTLAEPLDRAFFEYGSIWDRVGVDLVGFVVNAGRNWSGAKYDIMPPTGEPLMQAGLFGRSPHDVYGTQLPNYQPLRYDPVNPVTYEVVFLFQTMYSHPVHFHGQLMQVIHQGYFDPVLKWRCKGVLLPQGICTGYRPQPLNLPDLSMPVAGPKIADVFFGAPLGYVIFRFTGDNPGAWLLHCTMGQHLEGGMYATLDVRASEGLAYPITPPDNHTMCGRPAATYRNLLKGNAKDVRTISEDILQRVVHRDDDDDDDDDNKLYVVIVILAVLLWNMVILSGVAVTYAMFLKKKNRKLALASESPKGNCDKFEEDERPVWVPRSL